MTYESYLAACARLREMDEAYYEKDAPIAANAEYDALKRQAEDAEAANPGWKARSGSRSPSLRPGGRAGKKKNKIRHPRRLLSLKDYFSEDELRAWYESIGSPAVSTEEKIDGLTLSLEYRSGKLAYGATRGDGDVGEDVTANVAHVAGIPEEIPGLPDGSVLRVRCECYQPVTEFLRCNKTRRDQGLEPYANPRACASGGLRADDQAECKSRGLRAFAFQVLAAKGLENFRNETQTGDLAWLASLGFAVVAHKPCRDFAAVIAEIAAIKDRKAALPYWTDGAVVKTDDLALQAEIGEGSKYPAHSAAYKYPAEIKETVIRNIRLQTGRTGVITPVAEFDPVYLAGTTVSNATLHNQKFIDDHRINVGCTVEVTKSGEIIPKIVGVPVPAENPFRIERCPSCGARAVEAADENGGGSGVMYCLDASGCPAQKLRYFEFFCSKDVMDIDGLGPAAVDTLASAGLLGDVSDIYDLPGKLAEIAALPGFGKKKAENLARAIEKSKQNDIDRLIKALGIPSVGRHIGRALAAKYPDMDTVQKLSAQELMAIEGIGEITARDIVAAWPAGKSGLLDRLAEKGVNMRSLSYRAPGRERTEDAKPLAGLTIVATGTIEGYDRAGIEDFIAKNGGKAAGSVSKKTSCVVAGANAGSKLQKAKDLGIPVYAIDEFKAAYGLG